MSVEARTKNIGKMEIGHGQNIQLLTSNEPYGSEDKLRLFSQIILPLVKHNVKVQRTIMI